MAFLILSSICSSRVLRNDRHASIAKKLIQLGSSNTFTGKETLCPCFEKDTDIAWTFCQIYKNPRFLEDDLEKEKYVIMK